MKSSQWNSNHRFVKMIMSDEEIHFWNESVATFILTNKRLMIFGQNRHKSGDRKRDRVRHEYIFPISGISSIHRSGLIPHLVIDASGTTYSFLFAPGKDQFGNKVNLGRKDIIQTIGQKISDLRYSSSQLVTSSHTEKDIMFCRFCGNRIMLDSVFCRYCGKELL